MGSIARRRAVVAVRLVLGLLGVAYLVMIAIDHFRPESGLPVGRLYPYVGGIALMLGAVRAVRWGRESPDAPPG